MSNPIPYFSAAGRPTALFTIADTADSRQILEVASVFLGSAIELGIEGAGMQDSGRWAIVYLAEMAKAIVDNVVDLDMAKDRTPVKGANHG